MAVRWRPSGTGCVLIVLALVALSIAGAVVGYERRVEACEARGGVLVGGAMRGAFCETRQAQREDDWQ